MGHCGPDSGQARTRPQKRPEEARVRNRAGRLEGGQIPPPAASLSSLSLHSLQHLQRTILALHKLMSQEGVWPPEQVWLCLLPIP